MTEQAACDACREDKVKCSRERPICARCQTRGLKCAYSQRKKYRPRRKKGEIAGDGQTPSTPGSSLNGSSIGRLDLASPGVVDLGDFVPQHTAELYVKAMAAPGIYDKFLVLVDPMHISTLPYVSDHTREMDPATLSTYHCMLKEAWIADSNPDLPMDTGSRLYEQCRARFADWTDKPLLADMDLLAITPAIYYAKENFDFQAAHLLFALAARIVKQLGLLALDADPRQSLNTDPKTEARRLAFWQIIREECILRTFYGMPPVLTTTAWKTNLPTSSMDPQSMASWTPTMAAIMLNNGHISLLNLDCLQVLDNAALSQAAVGERIQVASEQLRAWMAESQVEEGYERVTDFPSKRLYAETLIYAHSLIVKWEERIRNPPDATRRAVRHSARRVLEVAMDLAARESQAGRQKRCVNLLSAVSVVSFAAFLRLRKAVVTREAADPSETAVVADLLAAFSALLLRAARTHGTRRLLPLAEYFAATATGDPVLPGLA